MTNYELYSKEELIHRIKELENQIKTLSENISETNSTRKNISDTFKSEHAPEVLDILPDMLSIFDHNCNFVALASSEETVHVGGSSDNLVGKNLLDILPSDAYKPVKMNFDKVITTGQASIGYHNLYVNGKLENFENRVIPLNDNYILCICRNITDRINAQSQLQMVTSAVNNSIEEFYAIHTDGTLLFANKQFINHYKLNKDLNHYKIYDILPYITEKSWQTYIHQLKAHAGAINQQEFNQHFQHTDIQQEISSYIVKNNNGEEIIWTIARDISERIERENKIRELNQLMETILNNIPVYLFVKDTGNDFRYLYWNKEFENKSKIPASAVIGRTDAEIFPDPKDAERFREDDLKLLHDRQLVDFEEDYMAANQERRVVHTMKALVPLEGKQPLLIGISWDVTEQKKTEAELIKARIKAEESDKLKSAFLANMSHEIRTPLNAIVGFSKLLAETDNLEERRQYCDIIDNNTELLLQLINDILDLSKIEAGMLEFTEKNVNINDLCQDMYEIFNPRIQPKVKLIYEPSSEIIVTFTDGNRLSQVLSNLLTNAHKFTTQGEIRFGFRLRGEWIDFFVKDTGMGITKENLDKIFTRFVKLNNFIQGTGLGLPICQMIIENLGGKISVESEENVGTAFYFNLPYKKVITPLKNLNRNTQNSNRNSDTQQQQTILIAEDVNSNFLLLKSLLGKNYRILHALTGKEAIELFQKEHPDLILMDIKMPEMDGLEATQMIRQYSTEVPIIALTAFAFESDKQAALNAGCNAFLTKPIVAESLKTTINNYI